MTAERARLLAAELLAAASEAEGQRPEQS
jgi:hypothetical protein